MNRKIMFSILILLVMGAGHPSAKAQDHDDAPISVERLGPKELIDFGEKIIFGKVGGFKEGGVGKGMCPACHGFRKDEKRPVERAPNLSGIIARADERVKEPDFLSQDTVQTESFPGSGRANSGMEYLAESKVCPSCYVVPGFEVNIGGKKASVEPAFHKPPINLTVDEMIAIDTWLYNRDGLPAPPTGLLRMAYEKFIVEGDGAGPSDQPPARIKKEIGDSSRDVYYGTKGTVSGPPLPELKEEDYPRWDFPFPFENSRKIIWFVAQQHIYFGGLISGILFLGMLFELRGSLGKSPETRRLFDGLSRKFAGGTLGFVHCAAIFGVLLLFSVITLYRAFFSYLLDIFFGSVSIYGLFLLLFLILVYVYYFSWEKMGEGFSKFLHIGIGAVSNAVLMTILVIGNAWSTFMVFPSGVDDAGHFLGNFWNAFNNPLWMPMNFLRFIGNFIFAASVMAAYAGYKALVSKSREDRAYYDWMGYVSFLCLIGGLFTIPIIGHWVSHEVIGYRGPLGIAMFLGNLSWAMLTVVSLMGVIFLCVIYYVWQRIGCLPAKVPYRNFGKPVFFILAVCLMVYITPSNLALTMDEFRALEGRVHPLVHGYGVETAKQAAVHIMLLVAGWAILLYWKGRFRTGPSVFSMRDGLLTGIFLLGGVSIIVFSIFGFEASLEVRSGLAASMAVVTFVVMGIGIVLTRGDIQKGNTFLEPDSWGALPARGHFALITLALVVSWLMGLGGFLRSALRGEWHVNEILQDHSAWSDLPTAWETSGLITLNAVIFWTLIFIFFWLEERSGKKRGKGTV